MERVGVHDNFFELGGHSLLATQVVSKLRRSFEVEIPLRTLFTDPTVAGLSHNITEAQRSGNYYRPMPIGRISREQYRVTAAIGRVD